MKYISSVDYNKIEKNVKRYIPSKLRDELKERIIPLQLDMNLYRQIKKNQNYYK